MFTITTQVDGDRDGHPRRLKDGSYRFNIVVKEGDKVCMVIKGFRMPESMIKIIPPASVSAKGIYTIVDMEVGFEGEIKDMIERIINKYGR